MKNTVDKSGRIALASGIMNNAKPDRQKLEHDYKVTLKMKSNPEKANPDQTKHVVDIVQNRYCILS